MFYLCFYILVLQLLGSLTFYHLVDSSKNDNAIKIALNEISGPWRALLVFIIWPIAMAVFSVMALAAERGWIK